MKFDVIAFGSVTVDTFLTSSEFKIIENEAAFKGAAICEAFGAKIEIDKRVICGGGGGGNVVVGLSRLGLNASLVAKMGNDFFSEMIITELKDGSVCVDQLVQEEGETDAGVVLVSGTGGRTILIYRGKTKLEEKDIKLDDLSSSWFHIASLEGNLDLVNSLINIGEGKNTKVCWNPGKKELESKKAIFEILPKVEILVLNQQEAEDLFEMKMEDLGFWDKAMALPVKMFFLTQGKKGAFLVVPAEKKKIHASAFSFSSIEDTGAGDAFCSGIIAASFYQKTPKETLLWGLANGAGVVRQFGAKEGLMTKEEIEKVVSQESDKS